MLKEQHELVEILRSEVAKARSQMHWARDHRLSMSYLSGTLSGKHPVRGAIARLLGYEMVTLFRKKETNR